MPTNKLGNTLRNLRIAKGYTQQDVATRVPCTRGYIAQLELSIRVNPDLETLKALSSIYAVPISTLLS
jgi:transcriptional regulator with XRE-family HTH domain